MLYLGTASSPEIRLAMSAGILGQMRQPDAGNPVVPCAVWAADNGCFNPRHFTFERWERWLDAQPRTALWATVPDVILDHDATLARWVLHVDTVKRLGFKAAFCAQDGCVEVPSDADCVFLGGTTEWKVSDEARFLVDRAKEHSILTHMGRVNSLRRLRLAHMWECDTVDGTFLAYAPEKNFARLLYFLDRLEVPPYVIPTERICSRCGDMKALDQFSRDRRRKSGHAGKCQQCKNEQDYRLKSYLENVET